MKRYATATIITLLVIAIALPVFGHDFGQRGNKNIQHRNVDGMSYVGKCYGTNTDLTAEQYKNLKDLHDRYFEETIPLRSELFAKRSELRVLWNKENPDGEKIKAKHREMDRIQNQLRDKKIDYKLEANKIVPLDQRKEFCGGNDRWGFMGRNDHMSGDRGMGRMHR